MDSNNGWNGYMRAIQLCLIDAGSSMHSLSVLLSAVKMSLRTQTGLEIAQWASSGIISTHVCVPPVLAVSTIRGQRLIYLEPPIVRLRFEGGDYSRAASNRINTVHTHTLVERCNLISFQNSACNRKLPTCNTGIQLPLYTQCLETKDWHSYCHIVGLLSMFLAVSITQSYGEEPGNWQ